MNNKVVLAVALISGTAIGAGTFSLPFIFSQIGIGFALFYLIAFALVYFSVNWRYANLLELTGKGHRYFFVTKKFLGKTWSRIASFITLISLVLSLTVYLILSASFASLVLDLNPLLLTFLFWLFASIPIFFKISWASVMELLGILGIFIIAVTIFIAGLSGSGNVIEFNTLFKKVDFLFFLLPFGPLLYSLSSRNAVARVFDLLEGDMAKIKKALIFGMTVPVVVYFLFVVGVLGLSSAVTPDTISGLGFLPSWASVLIGLVGLLTLWTSYLMIGGNIFENLKTDVFNDSKEYLGAIFVLLGPPLLYLAGLNNFLFAVGFVGGIFLSLEAIFINTMWHKAKKKKISLVSFLILCVFVLTIVYELGKGFFI